MFRWLFNSYHHHGLSPQVYFSKIRLNDHQVMYILYNDSFWTRSRLPRIPFLIALLQPRDECPHRGYRGADGLGDPSAFARILRKSTVTRTLPISNRLLVALEDLDPLGP